ncbi:MAG: hypothetical protein LKJ21_01850 [Oscillospiraceae bacterium]|nr:hypothetical protein [Oscillospiraceae bacterium]MCI1990909.1 hypothetical protein [Oscillospiraceae bacterium]MCI2034408.1 hypothetical protein [Oscillospiraceae bacterium]
MISLFSNWTIRGSPSGSEGPAGSALVLGTGAEAAAAVLPADDTGHE